MNKTTILLALLSLLSLTCFSQEFRGLDKSPLDRAYLPDDFSHDRKFAPERKLGESAILKVDYSRPQKKGREVFGGMVKYNEIWRLGANEATEIMVSQDIEINGQLLSKGTYSMYAIPNKESWIVIFNKDLDQWGHYSYQKDLDVLRLKTPTLETNEVIEAFSIQFEDLRGEKAKMHIAWDKTRVELSIDY